MSTATKTVFVPKLDDDTQVTIDDALTRIKALREAMKPLEEMEKNLIECAKTMMKAKGETKHVTPDGVTATFAVSQRSEVNKELAKELLGDDWARVHSFKSVTSFTVK